jgi:hypothetical protein
MPVGGLCHTTNATRVEWDCSSPRFFSFFLSLEANSLFQDLSSLVGGPKTANGKESLSSSHKRFSGWGTPCCHPKPGDTTFWPTLRLQMRLRLGPLQLCPWKTYNQISYTSFMVSVAWEWRLLLASSAPVLPLWRIDLDSSDDQWSLMHWAWKLFFPQISASLDLFPGSSRWVPPRPFAQIAVSFIL